MNEIWKDIIGYEGLYQISDCGNVRSLDRRVINNRCGSSRPIKGAVLKPWGNGNGYLVVSLNRGRKRQNKYVHRLVAEHFINNPLSLSEVNHIDYNKHNNALQNLEWCTHLGNIAHSVEHMRKPKTKSRPTNTGEKYITERVRQNKPSLYRVNVPREKIEKTFKTLEEAIFYRNEVVQKWQNQSFKKIENTATSAV